MVLSGAWVLCTSSCRKLARVIKFFRAKGFSSAVGPYGSIADVGLYRSMLDVSVPVVGLYRSIAGRRSVWIDGGRGVERILAAKS